MRVRLLSLLAVALIVMPAAADDVTSFPAIAPQSRMVTKTFNVADLVIQPPGCCLNGCPVDGQCPKAAASDHACQLIKMITRVCDPHTWDTMGGPGLVEYRAEEFALVVRNSAQTVHEVSKLLDALREVQGESLACEVRVVCVPVGFCQRLGLKPADNVSFSDSETAKLMEAVQSEPTANVMQAPKVTLFNGQTATVRCGNQKPCPTGVEAQCVDGTVKFVPKMTMVDLGESITICGHVSADRKFVKLQAKYVHTQEACGATRVAVEGLSHVMPEGGSSALPTPFAQEFQLPCVQSKCVEKKAVVPSGRTMIVGMWKEPGKVECCEVPMLSKVPYVSRLFKNVGVCPEREVIVLATPRVIPPEPTECRPPAQVASATIVAAPAKKQVMIGALVAHVPSEFLSNCGLVTDDSPAALVLNPRETKLLTTLIAKEPNRNILSRPQLVTMDSRQACLQIGGEQIVLTGVEITAGPDGPVVTPKKERQTLGLQMCVTPKITANGMIELRSELYCSEPDQGSTLPLTLPPEITGQKKPVTLQLHTPAPQCRSIQTVVRVANEHTVLIRGGKSEDGKKEMVILLTPQVLTEVPAVMPAGR